MSQIDWFDDDALWVRFRNLLNLNTTINGCHYGRLLSVTVQNEGEVDLPDDVNSLMNENGVHHQTYDVIYDVGYRPLVFDV